jgi:hypothetical protein
LINLLENVLNAYGLNLSDWNMTPFGDGNIQQTYALERSGEILFLLQCINTTVFENPRLIAENWSMAARHIAKKAPAYTMLRFIPTLSGEAFAIDAAKKTWRLLPFIPNSISYPVATDADMAREAATAFGSFAALLTDATIDAFHPVIPGFHDLLLRNEQYNKALQWADASRIEQAASLIQRLKKFEWMNGWYARNAPKMPLRLLHMDAKMGNILFDRRTRDFLAIVDFDTLMPGLIFSDIGDLVRSMACTADENETNPSNIQVRADVLAAIHESYAAPLEGLLTATEEKNMLFGGPLLVYIQALRFLTDFLNGNVYYKINYPQHNYMRAMNQTVLLEKLLEQQVYRSFIP